MKVLFTTSTAPLIVAACMLCGCGDSPDPNPISSGPVTTGGEGQYVHAHPSEGPHGGDLIELGNEEYHAELLDQDGITIYILDAFATQTTAIEAVDITINLSHDGTPAQFKLTAAPTEDDPDGRSSRFTSADKELVEHLHEEENVEGTLVLQINGKSYRGKLTHEHEGGHGHAGHAHGEDDALVWRGEPREHAGLQVQLGQHGKHLHAGEAVEPAVAITRDGQPVSDAKVFNSLLSEDGETVLAEEVATIFEPTTKDEPAHYAQGELLVPKGSSKVVIRYRIATADGDEATFDVPVEVE